MKKYIVLLIVLVSLFFINCSIVLAENTAPTAPTFDFVDKPMTCSELLGTNGVKLIRFGVSTVRIVAAIIAIVQGMLIMIPPITNKDYGAINKALKTLVKMLIVLVLIFLLPTIIRVVGLLFEFDLSCVF